MARNVEEVGVILDVDVLVDCGIGLDAETQDGRLAVRDHRVRGRNSEEGGIIFDPELMVCTLWRLALGLEVEGWL
ncbi:hypothetical protein JCM24511_07340 [Saitozyma sp. JCM 24511]|nr:hypothetical protein JCM24511_07340 [Saitozyma sp. JCM 24511]